MKETYITSCYIVVYLSERMYFALFGIDYASFGIYFILEVNFSQQEEREKQKIGV